MEKLGSLYAITSGGTPSRKSPKYYENGSISWVKTGDLKEKYLFATEEKITQAGLDNSSAKIYPPDTVLIAMYGATIGATSILKIHAATNQACAAFIKRNDILPEYLYSFLQSQQSRFEKEAVGGAQPNISAGYLKQIEIPIPTFDKQTEIVVILGTVDALIEKRKQQLSKLDELVKARFVEMFGNPVLNPKKFPCYTVDDVIEFQGGSQPDKKFFEYIPTDNNIRLIQIRDYKSDKYITYIPKSMARRFCTENDIMIGRYGPPIFQILKGIEGSFNVALMKATPKMGNREFIRQFLKQDCLLEYLEGLSQRTAGQDGIQMDKLKAYPFPYPPIELQNEFASFVEQTDKLNTEVKQSLEKLETLKKALMQKYFG